MVGHATGQHPHRHLLNRIRHPTLEGGIVGFIIEDRRPGIGAVQHVENRTARCHASGARHEGKLNDQTTYVYIGRIPFFDFSAPIVNSR